MFQPTEFVPVKPEGIAEWERLMIESAGLQGLANLKDRKARSIEGIETTSLCPGGGADDCDWHQLTLQA